MSPEGIFFERTQLNLTKNERLGVNSLKMVKGRKKKIRAKRYLDISYHRGEIKFFVVPRRRLFFEGAEGSQGSQGIGAGITRFGVSQPRFLVTHFLIVCAETLDVLLLLFSTGPLAGNDAPVRNVQQ